MPTTSTSFVTLGWTIADAEASFPDAVIVDVAGGTDVASAVDVVAAGGTVVVVADPDAVDSVVADLRRIGPVRVLRESDRDREAARRLPDDAQRLLDLLAEGLTLGAAARSLNLSRRTADRRLAQARRQLGARTTAQAVARSRPRHPGAGQAPPRSEDLLGRDEPLSRIAEALAADGAVLVVGEGGVGKSALVTAAAAASGRLVRSAAAVSAMQVRRLWPLTQALGVDLVGDVDAVAERVEALVGPGVLVVDDVHLSDPATVDVLCALAGRVAMLAAARPVEAVGNAADRLVEAGFGLEGLLPLPVDAAERLARVLAPDLPGARVREIAEASGGLPLLVEYFCGADPDAPVGRQLVPRVEALTDAAFATALHLAVAGTSGAPDENTEALLSAGIAHVRPDGTVALRHALVGEALVSAASAHDRAEAHRRAASTAPDPVAAAQHWREAGELERARRAAADAAGRARSLPERARLLGLVAECAADDKVDSVLRAGSELSAAGLHADVLALLDRIDGEPLVPAQRAGAALLRSRALWHAGESAAACAEARAGIACLHAEPPTPRLEAALLVEAVRGETLSTGARDEHQAMLDRAAELVGDGPGAAALLSVRGIVDYLRDGSADAWEAGRRAAAAEDDIDSLMRCSNNLIMWHESSGDPAEGLALALDAAEDADRRNLVEWRSQFQAMAANLLYHAGRHADAFPLLEMVESVAGDPRTRRQARVCRASILIDLGLLDAAADLIPPLAQPGEQDWMHDDSVTYLHAALALAQGRPRDALAVAGRTEDGGASGDINAFLEPVKAWAAYDLGLTVTPPEHPSRLPLTAGLVLEVEGVARLRDDPAEAAVLLSRSAEAGAGWTFGPALRARWGAAEAHRRAGSAHAVDLLLEVEALAARHGYEPLLARIHSSLRSAGVPRSTRVAERSGLLTARESQVLDLVAAGYSYDEVARRLGVGRPTVRRLLDNARTKLGASSRLEAVASSVDGRV